MSGRNQVGANVVDACDLKPLANQRVRDETFAEVTDPLRSPRIRFDGFPPSPVLSAAIGLAERLRSASRFTAATRLERRL
jgi:hypothetical protein